MWKSGRFREKSWESEALTIYTECLEIWVGKWNGTYHSIWNISEIGDYRLNQCILLFFVNFLIDCSTFCDISVLRLDKLQHWIFTPKISTRMDDVNGKRPGTLLEQFPFLLTVKTNGVIAIATLREWLKSLAPGFEPMRSKTKTNCSLCHATCPAFWVSYKSISRNWFIALLAPVVIVQSNYFVIGFSTVIWKPLHQWSYSEKANWT